MAANVPPIDWDAVWRGDTSGVRAYTAAGLEVASLEGKGRGVVATACFAAGDLLLAEQALTTAPEPKLAAALVALKLKPHARRRLELMCDGSPTEDPQLKRSPSMPWGCWPSEREMVEHEEAEDSAAASPAVSLARMKRIVQLNAYRCSPPVSEYAFIEDNAPAPSEAERHQKYGVFPLGSLVNHSCAPNVSKVLLSDWVFLRAARSISPGEELTQFYCDIRMPVEMRESEMREEYGFACNCRRCLFEQDLEKLGGSALSTWKDVYSCQVPGFHGPPTTARLQSVLSDAERSADIAAANYRRRSTSAALQCDDEEQQQWMRWPMIPLICQLAARLLRDGRVADSVVEWRRAEGAARAVMPFSNVHLRILGELLLTMATASQKSQKPEEMREAIAGSLAAVRAGFGHGLSVWQMLLGFRMPSHIQALAEEISMKSAELGGQCELPNKAEVAVTSHDGASTDNCHGAAVTWSPVERDELSGLKRATLTVHSTAFVCAEDIRFDASPSEFIIGCPGIGTTHVACPFAVDVGLLAMKFSRKRCSLTICASEAVGS
eukprot:gnl/TRDRNA2_/TRDRNA2_29917_c0_seq1.p1 gnl/TRDRNA2_/TRDRNA2_29917_c0~~gnl/TRDRNA2_/TRDRNA2_29917_c0_seq1.p1  ORF type:complete len:551 (+),score=83.89 gnl/TRDRNA2_/TRDRNA2_29917_c0_seq1:28-1680(+)